MNPVLLKTLLSMASNNAQASASSKQTGMDAQMRSRTVLYPDEPVDLPRWGISAMPSMILGAAPQTCLFVKDLTVIPADPDRDSSGKNSPATPSPTSTASTGSSGTADDSAATPTSDTVSFSLSLESPPETQSGLSARQITWQLSMPVAGYRDIKTSANSDSVRAPVIRTLMQLRGINRDVEIGLLEMGGIDQPLLIGQDTLGDQFLIRPDRAPKETPHQSPSATVAPADSEDADTSDNANATKDAPKAQPDTKNQQDNGAEPPATATPAPTPSTPEKADDTPAERAETQPAPTAPTAKETNSPKDVTPQPQPETDQTQDQAQPTPSSPAAPQPTSTPTPPAEPSPQNAPTAPATDTTPAATITPAPAAAPATTDASSTQTPPTIITPAPAHPQAPAEPSSEPKPENT
ncbi:hypothetical protein [Thalassospira lucentensis]|uniref:hypothetical protein n=1 Tax=Thalassospira lucentensis TaxID=168935 RepID=UPI003AA97BA4